VKKKKQKKKRERERESKSEREESKWEASSFPARKRKKMMGGPRGGNSPNAP
jgi:hypothetical protein